MRLLYSHRCVRRIPYQLRCRRLSPRLRQKIRRCRYDLHRHVQHRFGRLGRLFDRRLTLKLNPIRNRSLTLVKPSRLMLIHLKQQQMSPHFGDVL
jgi:hypothetical protein